MYSSSISITEKQVNICLKIRFFFSINVFLSYNLYSKNWDITKTIFFKLSKFCLKIYKNLIFKNIILNLKISKANLEKQVSKESNQNTSL